MIENVSNFAEAVAARLSRRGFLRRVSGWSAGLAALLTGSMVSAQGVVECEGDCPDIVFTVVIDPVTKKPVPGPQQPGATSNCTFSQRIGGRCVCQTLINDGNC